MRGLVKHRLWGYAILLAIISASLFSYTYTIPIAERAAEQYVQDVAEKQLDVRQPFLPEDARAKSAQQQVRAALQSDDARRAVQEETERITDYYTSPSGAPYLFHYDPFYFMKGAERILNGATYSLSEVDDENLLQQHIIAGVASLYTPPSVEHGAFWTSAMLGVVATLLFFIIGTVLFDPDTSFIAGLLFVAQPGIVNVFKGGSPDTSSLNIALSIAIFLSYVTAFKAWRDFDLDQPESYTRPFTFTILTIVLFFVFRTAWTGFFYVVPFIAAHIALYWFITLLKHDWRWSLAPPAAMLAGLAIVWNSPFVRRTLYRLNIVDQTDVYPTAWSTVSELGPAGLDAFIGLYGWALLLLTVVGGALLAWREWSTLTATSFVLVWASLIVTPFFSGRFFIFAIAPVCLIAAYGIRRAGSYLATMEAFIPHTYRRVIWTGLLTVLVIVTAIPQSASALHLTPHMNDNRLHVAETIKEETGHDTQVQTWWDNGYMYEYYTDRQALFDGGSFVPHRVYWFAKALLDTNASKSANMMRMLHCGGGSHLDRYGSRPDRAVETLYSVMGTSRESARERIGDDVDRTHCVKNETLVVSSSILPKLPALKQFATWDFLLQRPAEDTARFQHGTCVENVCDYGFSYDLEAGRASFRGGQPSTFIYVNNSFGNRTVVEQPGGIDLTALVVGNDLFLLEEGMEDTVLIRALFFNDLNTFDLLTYTKDRERVVAYDVAPKI